MLRRPTIAVALAFLAAASAHAGTRATYGGDPGHALVVEVTDVGDVRVQEQGSSDYGILRDGEFYIVGSIAGQPQVARLSDLGDAVDAVVPAPIFAGILAHAPAPAALAIRRGGPETVAGRKGTDYAIGGLDPQRPDMTAAYVMSTDADLVPVGRALEAFMNAALLPGAAFTGPATATLVRQTRAIFALGTPLDAGGRLRLERVETLPIPMTRTDLPTPPTRVEDLIGAMRAGAAR